MEKKENFDIVPKFYELLSKNDKILYNNMRQSLSSHACRNRRGKRLETFSEMLNTIKTYCVRNDEDDWKRCLVCGVCWLPNGIAINTRHLSLLIDKCKSSINGSLQKMGYSTLQSRTESSSQLSDCIPLLKNNFNELREWTIRQYMATTPNPHLQVGGNPMPNMMNMPPQSPTPQMMMNYAMTPNPRLPIPVMPQYYMQNYGMPMQAAATPVPQFPTSVSQPQISQPQVPVPQPPQQSPSQGFNAGQTEDYQNSSGFDGGDYGNDIQPSMLNDNGFDDLDDPLALTPSFIYDDFTDAL